VALAGSARHPACHSRADSAVSQLQAEPARHLQLHVDGGTLTPAASKRKLPCRLISDANTDRAIREAGHVTSLRRLRGVVSVRLTASYFMTVRGPSAAVGTSK
jgi:hypothetical protein